MKKPSSRIKSICPQNDRLVICCSIYDLDTLYYNRQGIVQVQPGPKKFFNKMRTNKKNPKG